MIGTGGGLSWACLKLWPDSGTTTDGRCCKLFDRSMWFEFGTVFVGRGGLSVTMLALENTPGPWFNRRKCCVGFNYLNKWSGRNFECSGTLTGVNRTPLYTFPLTVAVIRKPESKAPSTLPRTSDPIWNKHDIRIKKWWRCIRSNVASDDLCVLV